jgi:hypothetical protein
VIKHTALRCDAHSIAVVSIPYGIYACEKNYKSRLFFGYTLAPTMLSDNTADKAISLACQKADIPFISITESFRNFAKKGNLFYTYDGHFNAQGHAIYAQLITPAVIEIITQNKL